MGPPTVRIRLTPSRQIGLDINRACITTGRGGGERNEERAARQSRQSLPQRLRLARRCQLMKFGLFEDFASRRCTRVRE